MKKTINLVGNPGTPERVVEVLPDSPVAAFLLNGWPEIITTVENPPRVYVMNDYTDTTAEYMETTFVQLPV